MVSTRGSVISDYNVGAISYKVYSSKNFCSPELPKVRRNLFGITREVQTAAQLEDFTERAAKSCKDWNFDFIKECPLTGRYLWHRVRASDMPVFYTAVRQPTLNAYMLRTSNSEEDSGAEDYCTTSNDENEHFNEKVNKEEETVEHSISKKPRLVQTSMKDYTRVQKRRSSHRLRMKQIGSPRIRKYLHQHENVSSQL